MTTAEAIYEQSLRLPEEAAREALGFIEFLEIRYAVTPAGAYTPVCDQAARQAARQEALKRLDQIRIPWGGKPMANRGALWVDARGWRCPRFWAETWSFRRWVPRGRNRGRPQLPLPR